MSELTLRFAARSEIGRVRKNNEDAGYAATDLLVVADGMGGHEAGELASAATVAAVVAAASKESNADEVLGNLSEAVVTSGEYIADVVAANRDLAGMGTTMTVVALRGDRIAMAHVGDSRAYLYRDNELQQMTKDHTFVQSLVDSGEITKEQAAVHPRRNLMMRAIDGIHAVEVDLSVREARIGDRFLLCSDGLCGVIGHEVISECISAPDPTHAVTLLIDAAMAAGAPDNITVVVADVVNDELLVDPVLIGSAADSVNQQRLPEVDFPEESESVPEKEWEFELSKFKLKRLLIPILSTLGILALVAAGSLLWISRQWYVGVYAPTDSVAIYQGVASGGLSRLVEVSTLAVKELPDFERTQVLGTIDSSTHADAQAAVSRLQARADMCKGAPTSPGCPVVSQ